MKIEIDTDQKILRKDDREYPLYSNEAFEILSPIWVKVGWNQRYVYTFSWMGRPVIQLPEDLLRIQELLYRVRPQVLIETGVAHGGSLVFYASLFEAMGEGKVIGIDREIRPHNRTAIENHPLFKHITLVEGNSIAPEVISHVTSLVPPGASVMVILDSCHTKEHVRAELDAYSQLVTPDSYIVATDGIMEMVCDTPQGKPHWQSDNPIAAAREFLKAHPEFSAEEPAWPFNESSLTKRVTHWPESFLKRKPAATPPES